MQFHAHEILWNTSAFDEKNGKWLSCKLDKPRLVPDAVPSQFPNCPSYLSENKSLKRQSRDDLLKSKEENLLKATQKSLKDFEEQQ